MSIFLKMVDLHKKYVRADGSTLHALRGVNLEIQAGEIFGLLGPNGAGKSTLASLIMTVHPATSGQILYKGKNIVDDLDQYRREIAFCPQKPNLYPHLSIYDNLMFAALFRGFSRQQAEYKIQELAKRYTFTKYLDQQIHCLSGGYKQRVCIARALITEPKLILLDEPTVGLDPHIRRYLWQEIKQLKELGVTVILTTHYLDEAEYLADRICVLHEGKVRFLGRSQELKDAAHKNSLEEVMVGLFEEEAGGESPV